MSAEDYDEYSVEEEEYYTGPDQQRDRDDVSRVGFSRPLEMTAKMVAGNNLYKSLVKFKYTEEQAREIQRQLVDIYNLSVINTDTMAMVYRLLDTYGILGTNADISRDIFNDQVVEEHVSVIHIIPRGSEEKARMLQRFKYDILRYSKALLSYLR